MPDALIIGGGISGLACAIALKRADWTVEVFDAGQPIADPTSAEELDSQARYRGKGVCFRNSISLRLAERRSDCDGAQAPRAAGEQRQSREGFSLP